jgi:hypothetical protein
MRGTIATITQDGPGGSVFLDSPLGIGAALPVCTSVVVCYSYGMWCYRVSES